MGLSTRGQNTEYPYSRTVPHWLRLNWFEQCGKTPESKTEILDYQVPTRFHRSLDDSVFTR